MGLMALLPFAMQALQIGSNMWAGRQAEEGASSANSMNYQMFKENQDWQERMFKNRHTYEVADLRNAGLNPVLSANSAGSVPGSSYAPMQNEKAFMADIASNSAFKSAMIANTIENMKQTRIETKIKGEDLKLKEQEARLGTSLPGKIAYWLKKFNPLSGLFK